MKIKTKNEKQPLLIRSKCICSYSVNTPFATHKHMFLPKKSLFSLYKCSSGF